MRLGSIIIIIDQTLKNSAWFFSAETSSCSNISDKNVIVSVFLGFLKLLMDHLQTGKTVNSVCYCKLLYQMDGKLREKRSGFAEKKIFFIKTIHIPTKVF